MVSVSGCARTHPSLVYTLPRRKPGPIVPRHERSSLASYCDCFRSSQWRGNESRLSAGKARGKFPGCMFKRDFFTCSQREGEGLLAGSCWMTRRYSLVLERDRHLKWRGLDLVEPVLMVLCGVTLAGLALRFFSMSSRAPSVTVAVAARSHDDLFRVRRIHRRSGAAQ
jgi:hypothetical protein